ncbi:MAG TPA: acetate kinase, partial [Polyangiales bacterium]|nr:acetate kinase [Polyangiales bacterium]
MTVPTSHVLVVNCGSSSLKLALVEPSSGARPWQATGERLGGSAPSLTLQRGNEAKRKQALAVSTHEHALDVALRELPDVPLSGVGHRVVHGGEEFHESTQLDPRAIAAIEACSDLAPLHNPANLAGIRATLQRLPKLGQVAVFDTSFHHS